jgi:hypothetical protein
LFLNLFDLETSRTSTTGGKEEAEKKTTLLVSHILKIAA